MIKDKRDKRRIEWIGIGTEKETKFADLQCGQTIILIDEKEC